MIISHCVAAHQQFSASRWRWWWLLLLFTCKTKEKKKQKNKMRLMNEISLSDLNYLTKIALINGTFNNSTRERQTEVLCHKKDDAFLNCYWFGFVENLYFVFIVFEIGRKRNKVNFDLNFETKCRWYDAAEIPMARMNVRGQKARNSTQHVRLDRTLCHCGCISVKMISFQTYLPLSFSFWAHFKRKKYSLTNCVELMTI